MYASFPSLLTGCRCQSEVLEISLPAGTDWIAYSWSWAFHPSGKSWSDASKMGPEVWRDDDTAIGGNDMGVS